jgi:hypothetical protein
MHTVMPGYSTQGSPSGRNMRNTKTRSIGHLRQHILRHLSDGMNSGNKSSPDPVDLKALSRKDPGCSLPLTAVHVGRLISDPKPTDNPSLASWRVSLVDSDC